MSEELRDIVRQLRAELLWAQKTGIEVEAPRPAAVAPAAVVPAAVAPDPSRPRPTLAAIKEEIGPDCTRCKLHQGRKQVVFGVGNPNAELMFVGEAPGADEDQQGEPFVGKAGQLLTKIIEGMGLQRSDVYIANVTKCRPPNNRDPEPDEVAACEPFLVQQIEAIQPKVIVTLGRHASHTLLRNNTPITRLRGSWGTYQGIPVMPTYHPAFLLRDPNQKRPVWEDMKKVLAALHRPVPSRGGQ